LGSRLYDVTGGIRMDPTANPSDRKTTHPLTKAALVAVFTGVFAGAISAGSVIAGIVMMLTSASCWQFKPHCTGVAGDRLWGAAAGGAWIVTICLLLAPTLFTARWLQMRESRKAAPRTWKVIAGTTIVAVAMLLMEALPARMYGLV